MSICARSRKSRFGQPFIVIQELKKTQEAAAGTGEVSQRAGIQFCYHAHFHEFAKVDGTTGYDIMLKECRPELLKMEMDIFWVVYAGADPLHYWRLYPGRFPLLHIKDMRKDVRIQHQQAPKPGGPNPFAPVGQGRIDWRRIFAHVHEAGPSTSLSSRTAATCRSSRPSRSATTTSGTFG